ncbi:Na+/H+ antiporter NhaA [Nocardioides marmorisolisilvae]|uniref:Na(+)/H(+) antiporter NhaA n=1 Tax=Nocardioides marmorisolisilvae TaxID=1542737 RepID=A0A3N0E0H2_9ACTN|nr:Na+/H+ antiporter NhaA [Nocardioides marmorisolisilvae]RNL81300.1 Na+/H+ antiporter NhaA [Nocardioides marmorisolisilvae]
MSAESSRSDDGPSTWPHEHDESERRFVGDLLRSETVGGVIALLAAAAAVLWINLDAHSYTSFRHTDLGPLDLEHWAADGALTVFFFVAGLELKREFLLGSLRRPADAAVPVVAAVCGVAVPAGVYLLVNGLSSKASADLGGWAIPAATDIAFALAVLAVVGSALPSSLRAFLLTLAVVDDLVVIVIIALVYTDSLDLAALTGAVAVLAAYWLCQRQRFTSPVIYLPLAVGAWWLVHESGVHATIAGVVLGLLTRTLPDDGEEHPPAARLEHRIAPISSALAVPFFALMSAGVEIHGAGELARQPVVIGIVAGLVLGKPVGILLGSWAVTRFTRAELDAALSWRDLVGLAVLGGVGFTVSLLVSDLSFAGTLAEEAKTGVLVGSVLTALLGAALLGRRNRHHRD